MNPGYEIKADLAIAMQTMDITTFKLILERNPVSFMSLIDHNYSTIFHDLALIHLSDSLEQEFLEIYVSFFYKTHAERASELIKQQINKATLDDKSTPVHFAANSNKLVRFTQPLLKFFVKLGADCSLKDKNGQSAMHIAALKGYIRIIAYLQCELNMQFDEADTNGNTPVHLAIKENKEAVVFLFIAWQVDLEKKDKNGYTLLHSAANISSYRISKVLIIKGSNRKVKNNNGQTPYDIAFKHRNFQVAGILKTPGFLQRINPFKPPVSPKANEYCLFSIYIMIFVIRYLLVIAIMLPHFAIELSIASFAIFITSFVLFIAVNQKDPGYVKKTNNLGLQRLYEAYHSDYICPFCELKRPPKARHCQLCNKCVEDFDHHCPWIRNCVGRKNHSIFIAFVSVCCIDFSYTAILGVLDYFDLLQQDRMFFDLKRHHKELGLAVAAVCALSFCIAFPILLLQIKNRCKKRWDEKLKEKECESLRSFAALSGFEDKFRDEDVLTSSYDTMDGGCCVKRNESILSNI